MDAPMNLFSFFLLQKYDAATIFFLYGNKNVPSAEILRGRRRCLKTRTFILFGKFTAKFKFSSVRVTRTSFDKRLND
jgi:hypothetical protein